MSHHVSLHEIHKVLTAAQPGLHLAFEGENLAFGGLVAAEVGFGSLGVQLVNEGQTLVNQGEQVLSNLPHGIAFAGALNSYLSDLLAGRDTNLDILRLESTGDKVLGLHKGAISLQEYAVPAAVGESVGLLVHVADFVPHHSAIENIFQNQQTIQNTNNSAAVWNFAAAEFHAGVPVPTIAQQLTNYFTQ